MWKALSSAVPAHLRLAHEADEDVLQRGLAGLHVDRVALGDGVARSSPTPPGRSRRRGSPAEGRDLFDARLAFERTAGARRPLAGEDEGLKAGMAR